MPEEHRPKPVRHRHHHGIPCPLRLGQCPGCSTAEQFGDSGSTARGNEYTAGLDTPGSSNSFTCRGSGSAAGTRHGHQLSAGCGTGQHERR